MLIIKLLTKCHGFQSLNFLSNLFFLRLAYVLKVAMRDLVINQHQVRKGPSLYAVLSVLVVFL